MRKLSKADDAKLSQLIADIEEARGKLEDAISEYNDLVEKARDDLNPLIEALNDCISEADSFRDDVHSEMQTYWDERTEKWQESDNGSAYSEWMGLWEPSLDAIEIGEPEALEMPDVEALGTLEGLETELPA